MDVHSPEHGRQLPDRALRPEHRRPPHPARAEEESAAAAARGAVRAAEPLSGPLAASDKLRTGGSDKLAVLPDNLVSNKV